MATVAPRRANLTETVINSLSERIRAGTYAQGAKLPSELELCREFGVSRTVVREAVASLRLAGQLISRQGLGVFVADGNSRRLNFEFERVGSVRSAVQILELRLGVETEAVTLAATRRTPAAIAEITRAFDRLNSAGTDDIEQEAAADFAFHLAIARATNNPHFPQFLEALGGDITLDLRLKLGQWSGQSHGAYTKRIVREHGAILSAISQGDPKAARTALQRHLNDSLARYRLFLAQDQQTS
jgi:DNA-binding FadR family transcriptional regulator